MKSLNLKRINHIAIRCSSIEKSIEFYVGVLGSKLVGRTEGAAFLWLGDTDLTLEKSDSNIEVNKGFVSHLGFAVDSIEEVDSSAKILIENNVKVEKGPENRSDARFIYFRDIDGNPFELFYSFDSS